MDRDGSRTAALCIMGVGAALWSGCSGWHKPSPDFTPPALPTQVVAVMPVLNLSNRAGWDALQVTDMLALELQSRPGFAVIPVNRVLAAVAAHGAASAPTPAEVFTVGRELEADWVIVAAISDFDPFDPPRVAMTVQGYRTGSDIQGGPEVEMPTQGALAVDSRPRPTAPVVQIQAVYDAATDSTRAALRKYAEDRDGDESPYGWRLHAKSQQLFLRFSCHAVIQSIRQEIEGCYRSHWAGSH